MLLSEQFAALRPDPGALAVCWLGQAGFWIKDSENHTLAIDPYLTECGERMRGFKRISPLLVAPEELHADLYCVTHLHFDHFDYDAIPAVATHSETVFAGPASCAGKLREMGIGGERIVRLDTGGHFACPGIEVTAVPADHGEMAPDAIGLIVRMAGHTLYFSGDTAFHPEWIKKIRSFQPEIAFLSVNGRFGNMNAKEGARLAEKIKVRLAVPCHFWTFLEHGGDPEEFLRLLSEENGNCRGYAMRHGEIMTLRSGSVR